MGIFDFLAGRNRNTANEAKNRLRFIVEQQRSLRGAPDYLPLLPGTSTHCCRPSRSSSSLL